MTCSFDSCICFASPFRPILRTIFLGCRDIHLGTWILCQVSRGRVSDVEITGEICIRIMLFLPGILNCRVSGVLSLQDVELTGVDCTENFCFNRILTVKWCNINPRGNFDRSVPLFQKLQLQKLSQLPGQVLPSKNIHLQY